MNITKTRRVIGKRLISIVLGLLLLTATTGTNMKGAEAQPISFIDINPEEFDPALNDPEEQPWGIVDGSETDPNVYVTLERQGLLAKIDIDTRNVTRIFNDPDDEVVRGLCATCLGTLQHFYGIARDPLTDDLYITERDNGKIWRFNTESEQWTRIPIIERVRDPEGRPGYVEYPNGYDVAPFHVILHATSGDIITNVFTNSNDNVVFTNNFVWTGLVYHEEWQIGSAAEDGLQPLNFAGLARIDPLLVDVNASLAVERIPIPGVSTVTGLAVDSVDPSIIWTTDLVGGNVFKFNTLNNSTELITTFPPDPFTGELGNPRGIATDDNFLYVALNLSAGGDPAQNSTIARINKSTLTVDMIDTGATVFAAGTFSVFVNNDLLVWTDESNHVGIFDLSTEPPTPIIDETTGLPFFTTETEGNHYGIVPKDFEFWFAGRGSAKVGILPHSKFSGGRPVRPISPTSTGGSEGGIYRGRAYAFGDPNSARYDDESPIIANVMVQQGSMKISALINDNVGVKEASLLINKSVYPMKPHDGNPLWWVGTIPSSDLNGNTVFFKILAKDYSNNVVEYEGSAEVPPGSRLPTSQGASFVITPLSALHPEQNYSITVNGITAKTQNINPQIAIKNTSNESLQNIRLMLSPELKGKFLLSDYAIKSIAPNGEHTISLIMNGKPNVDEMGEPIPYNGHVIISIDNRTPYILELYGEVPNESALLQSMFMNMLESKAEKRYKTFEKPDTRISDSRYEVTLGTGENMIKSMSDELIIRNTGDKPLKNIRIATSAVADHFLLEQHNIVSLPAGSFIKVKLIPKLNNAESRDLSGELLVAPENAAPVSIPINIGKRLQEDKNASYEVSTLSGNSVISSTFDTMIIRNNGEETIDNVRIILPRELARIFSVSEDTFKSIEPNSERIIHISMRGTSDSSVKQILQDYSGNIIIVSSDGMKKVVPVNMVWKKISSKHFMIYARDNAEELHRAKLVINFLEHNYAETSPIVGETSSRSVIYITGSIDESILGDASPSINNARFIYSNSEDINAQALRESTYSTIMNNYGTYWTKQKLSLDNGNWLVDGISNYVTASIVGDNGMIKEQLDSFIAEPASFEWYGSATQLQYGASYTFFKFLSEKYNEEIIHKILSNLGSAMTSNHRCDTIEQCAVLEAIYDTNGLNMNYNRNSVRFDTILEEWKNYVHENYGVTDI